MHQLSTAHWIVALAAGGILGLAVIAGANSFGSVNDPEQECARLGTQTSVSTFLHNGQCYEMRGLYDPYRK